MVAGLPIGAPLSALRSRDLRRDEQLLVPNERGELRWYPATGMYVANYGIPNGELPSAGRRFLREFEAARDGEPSPDFSATYAAQAAEVLLDAIARSDGTRASVTRELLRTRVEDGILGDIRFDENGDLVEGPVTIYRIAGKRAVVDRVVTVSPTR